MHIKMLIPAPMTVCRLPPTTLLFSAPESFQKSAAGAGMFTMTHANGFCEFIVETCQLSSN
jgi:hypothetical protein